jgi:hypothetical protein
MQLGIKKEFFVNLWTLSKTSIRIEVVKQTNENGSLTGFASDVAA